MMPKPQFWRRNLPIMNVTIMRAGSRTT
jgi:hypothetical protein